MAHLIFTGGEQGGRKVGLHAVTCVGRARDMDIRVDDPAVSEKHARFLCGNDGRYVLEDLASAGGTFLNGEKVTSEWLTDGDEVRIGEVTFIFHEDPAGRDSREPADVAVEDKGGGEPGLLRETLYSAPAAPESIARAKELLATAADTDGSIFAGLDEDGILNAILSKVFDVFPETDRASVVLRREDTGELCPHAVRVAEGTASGQAIDVSDCLLEYVLDKKQAVLSYHVAEGGAGEAAEQEGGAALNVMCAPILSDDEVIGFVLAETSRIPTTYVAEGLHVLAALAGYAGPAIAAARLRG